MARTLWVSLGIYLSQCGLHTDNKEVRTLRLYLAYIKYEIELNLPLIQYSLAETGPNGIFISLTLFQNIDLSLVLHYFSLLIFFKVLVNSTENCLCLLPIQDKYDIFYLECKTQQHCKWGCLSITNINFVRWC